MHRCRHVQRARAVLGWALLFFIGVQVAWIAAMEKWFPQLYDAEFFVRLTMLRARIAEAPGRPLLLLLGSSRTVMSFVPEILPPLHTAAGQEPLPFNFSHLAAGPAMNLVELRRLLRYHIHPTWLVLELMPPQLSDRSQCIITDTAGCDDLPLVKRYQGFWRAYGRYVRNRLAPCWKHRLYILRSMAPGWIPPGLLPESDEITLAALGGDYSWHAEPHLDCQEIQRRTEQTRAGYFPSLQQFQIGDMSDRAVRETLRLCRQEGIHVVLVLTPEGSVFQSWYPPGARAEIDRYCAALRQEYAVPVVDARNWLADGDFTDSHHVLLDGAKAFTLRLGRDVLQPLIDGNLQVGRSARP